MSAALAAARAGAAAALANNVTETKRPLYRALPPAPVFPLDALGALRPAAETLHCVVQAPLSMCAQSALAAAALVIAPHYDVVLPSGTRPLTAIFASVAESGERKSSLDRLALRAIHAAERQWAEDAVTARAAYSADKGAYEAAVAAAKKGEKGGDRSAIRAALERLGPEPTPPRDPMLLVSDPTPEGLTLHLEGRPWCGVFTAEGGMLIGGKGFDDDSRMRTGSLFNALWDGDAIRRRRVLTGSSFLPGRRCSAHVMMQGVVAARLFGDDMLAGLGLTARILLVAPESAAGTRMWREPHASVWETLADYDARLAAFLDREPRMTEAGALDPVALPLHREARGLWIAFHDACEIDQRRGGELAGMRAFASKMPEHAGRLAATLAVYADPDACEVSADAMCQGIALAQHYAAEARRLASGAQVAPELRSAETLAAWWAAQPNRRQHISTIYQRGPASLRDAAAARRAVATLEEHGWLVRLPPGAVLDGKPRREAWEFVE